MPEEKEELPYETYCDLIERELREALKGHYGDEGRLVHRLIGERMRSRTRSSGKCCGGFTLVVYRAG